MLEGILCRIGCREDAVSIDWIVGLIIHFKVMQILSFIYQVR
jgi:hypothetical protein